MQSIWITVGPVLVINVFCICTFCYFLATRERWPVPPDLEGRHQSKLLGKVFHAYWYWMTTPVARFFVRLRFSPNNLTFIGFAMSCVAGYLFARGWFGYAGWVMIAGCSFDLLDGKVARLTNRERRSGAFYDSVMDRFGEGAVFVGLAYHYRASWLLPIVVWALVAAMLVSYTRARGEGVGVVCKKGPMQRPDRIVYLGIGSIFHPIADALLRHWFVSPPAILMIAACCIIAVVGTYSAFYRTIVIMDALDSADHTSADKETVPQWLAKLSTKEGREALLDRMKHGAHSHTESH
ncbi:MAG: CDP-alcohol phosphatidyltransferase family protein [Deltaproteobacteria bacterium]|nr:CDP-alcohol phosphatidyltransferase family protein [Deltaproteobacteria bacterium]